MEGMKTFDNRVTMNEYQIHSMQTSKCDYGMPKVAYMALGLAGEAGEVAEKVKKLFRDDDGNITEERKQAIILELGDCLWYLSAVAWALGTPLADVAMANRNKLISRKERGVTKGDGDCR